MLGRIERKGVGTVVGGVSSLAVRNARMQCEESTLGGVPATRYVLGRLLAREQCSVYGNQTYLTIESTRFSYVDRATKRAAVDCK